MKDKYNKKTSFAFQIMSRGSFVKVKDGKVIVTEVTIIRLNDVALNEWRSSLVACVRECCDHVESGWAEQRENCRRKIIDGLGISLEEEGDISINLSKDDVFTVVRTKPLNISV